MKKIVSIIIILSMLILPIYGEVISFEGGLVGDPTLNDNEYNYQEVIFITGKPIVLTGVVQKPDIPTDKDKFTIEYTYELQNPDENTVVERTARFDVKKTAKEGYNQTVYDYKLSELDETITIDGTSYILNSYIYDRSMIFDNTAAVDYFSGNMYLKRTYYTGGGTPIDYDEKVVIELTSKNNEGAMIGYNHKWGDAETYISKMTITAEVPNPDYDSNDANSEKKLSWKGFIDLKASNQKFSQFKYQKTAPQSISFLGSYVRVDEIENVFQYTYDLPTFDDEGRPQSKRNKGEESLRNDKIVDGTSMVIPSYNDIGGHWAEDSVFLLASLEVVDNSSKFYGPNQPMTRLEFVKMLSNAIASIEERSQTDIIRSLRPGSTQIFEDIPNSHPDYNYVLFAYNKGFVSGSDNRFKPDQIISRAEVITMMINALGLVDRAPQLPFETRYGDDESIPNWSKRFIYMADEIGLVKGYEDNTIKATSTVSRGEGAAMINNMIKHMKDNIRIDFREKVINRY